MKLQTFQTVRNSAEGVNALAVLLRDLIDYAGLFPPASLAMAPAVANYDEYLRSEWNWILGRFIVPVARLGEFEEAFAGLPINRLAAATTGTCFTIWRLSVLLGPDPAADVARIREFNDRLASSRSGRAAVVDSVEVKAASAEQIARLSANHSGGTRDLFRNSTCPVAPSASRRSPMRAAEPRFRTGGETADKFPASASVVEFIRRCAACQCARSRRRRDCIIPCARSTGLPINPTARRESCTAL